jgi:nucleoid-associated protein YgaU
MAGVRLPIAKQKEFRMADLNQLKQKYASVIDTIQSFSADGASVGNVALDGDKLLLQASVPSPVVADRVWDAIKKVDPTFADLHHEITTTGTTQSYTIQSGDSLSKVSKHFYGDANKYQKIASANGIADANKIQAGQTITIAQ